MNNNAISYGVCLGLGHRLRNSASYLDFGIVCDLQNKTNTCIVLLNLSSSSVSFNIFERQ